MATKKDYIAVATAIGNSIAKQDIADSSAYSLATELANYFEQDNPRFNRHRFFTVCLLRDFE